MIHVSQRDPRWVNDKIGYSEETIGKYGCLLTACSQVLTHYSIPTTPAEINNRLRNGGFIGADFVIGSLSQFGVLPRYVDCNDVAAPMAEINTELARGRPVIVEIDYKPDPEIQTHWVTIDRKNPDGNYHIFDPYPLVEPNGALLSRFVPKGTEERGILGVLFIAPYTKPVEDGRHVTTIKMNLRDKPGTGGAIIGSIDQGIELTGEIIPSATGDEWIEIRAYVAKKYNGVTFVT